MYKFSLLDVIKDSSVTKTIWRQELNSTEDSDILRQLLDAYLSVSMESLCREHTGCDVEYNEFYKKVLNKFEESYQ